MLAEIYRRLTTGIARIDKETIPSCTKEIRLFMRVRNESLRLPFFFEHYRRLGVDRFFIIDHDSSDNTRSILLSQPNTHVFSVRRSYKKALQGTAWIQSLLDSYGVGCWCLVVDADELLDLPTDYHNSLHAFCSSLEQSGANSVRALLLDLYSREPIENLRYRPGQNPIEVVSFFDSDISLYKKGPGGLIKGGVRKRIFDASVALTKHPIILFEQGVNIRVGMHHPAQGSIFSKNYCVLLHTKFLQDFSQRAAAGVMGKQYWNNSSEYVQYTQVLSKKTAISLWLKKVSMRYRSVEHIKDLGLFM